MVSKTKIALGFLTVVLLLSGVVYVSLGEKVRIRVDDDKTTFYVQENNRWVVGGREYNKLFDGSSLMYRSARNIEVKTTIDEEENTITIHRYTPYIREPEIIDTYYFDGKLSEVESVPIYHKVEILNAKDKFYRYEVRDLTYDGESMKLDGTSFSFGRNMKVEWQSGYNWARVYKAGILKVQYKIKSDYEVFYVRLFDPPLISFVPPTPADNTITSNKSIEIQANITSSDLKSVKFNWNGTDTTVFDNSLVLAFNFNNLSALGENDTHVFDISNSGNNGTVTGATPTSDGKYDGAFSFDGDGDKINCGNDESLNITGSITISAWFNGNEYDTGDTTIIGKQNGPWEKGYSLYHHQHHLNFFIENDSGTNARPHKDSVLVEGQWHHAVGTYDQVVGRAILYLDGELISNISYGGLSIGTNDDNLFIGRGDWYAYFNGTIDEVRIWNKSLTSSEVIQNYLMNLKKYDSDKWNLYVNQTMATDMDGIDYTYFACATNSTNSENCTSTRTITRIPISHNITSNFSSIHKIIDSRGVIGACPSGEFYSSYKIDIDDDGVRETDANTTWHKEAFLNMNGQWIRGSLSLSSSNYMNTSDVSGINFTGDFTNKTEFIKWTYDNNINVLLQVNIIPSWLVDNSSGNCLGDKSNEANCIPSNYTKYVNIFEDGHKRISNNYEYDNIYYEIGNEPQFSGWGMANWTDFFNNIYNHTKSLDNRIIIGGGGCLVYDSYKTFCEYTLENMTERDFYSFHHAPLSSGYLGNGEETNIKDAFDWIKDKCVGNCSTFIQSEGYINDATITTDNSKFTINMAYAYMDLLNYNSSYEVHYLGYAWQSQYGFSYYNNPTRHLGHPVRWDWISEKGLDNKTSHTYYPPYTVTKAFATYCPAGATVYTSTTTTNDLVAVTCKKGNMHNVIIINKGDEAINLTLNLENFTESTIYNLETKTAYTVTDNSTNIGSIDQYEIIYLGSDLQSPTITINSPTNTTYTTNTTYFNITLDEEGDTCYYSLDGASNISMTKQGVVTQFKAVDSSMTDGSHTVVFSCNDTWDNWGTNSVTFFVNKTFVSFSDGISALEFRPRHANDQDVWAVNQTRTKGVFNITNNAGSNVDVEMKLDNNQQGWGIECNSNFTSIVYEPLLSESNYAGRFRYIGNLDDSSYSASGSVTGANWISNGKVGGGYIFDGVNDEINISYSEHLNITGELTISTWVKFKNNTAFERIVAKSHTSGAQPYSMYGLTRVGGTYHPTEVDGQVRMELAQGGHQHIIHTTSFPPLDTWVHVVGTYNGSEPKLYYNGILETSGQQVYDSSLGTYVNMSGDLDYNSMPLSIGSDGLGSNFFNGTIDETMIWNRSLTAREVLTLYNYGEKKFMGTAGNWMNLTTTHQSIYTELEPNDNFLIWCRADLDFPSYNWNSKLLFNIIE